MVFLVSTFWGPRETAAGASDPEHMSVAFYDKDGTLRVNNASPGLYEEVTIVFQIITTTGSITHNVLSRGQLI